jgi:hypothetical protein
LRFRSSSGEVFVSVREKDNPELFAKVQAQNLLRQYDLLSNCIEIGLEKGIESFDKYTLWALNYAAVANIAQFGGRYREEPIYVGNHRPRTSERFQAIWIDSFLSFMRTGRLSTIQQCSQPTPFGD